MAVESKLSNKFISDFLLLAPVVIMSSNKSIVELLYKSKTDRFDSSSSFIWLTAVAANRECLKENKINFIRRRRSSTACEYSSLQPTSCSDYFQLPVSDTHPPKSKKLSVASTDEIFRILHQIVASFLANGLEKFSTSISSLLNARTGGSSFLLILPDVSRMGIL